MEGWNGVYLTGASLSYFMLMIWAGWGYVQKVKAEELWRERSSRLKTVLILAGIAVATLNPFIYIVGVLLFRLPRLIARTGVPLSFVSFLIYTPLLAFALVSCRLLTNKLTDHSPSDLEEVLFSFLAFLTSIIFTMMLIHLSEREK